MGCWTRLDNFSYDHSVPVNDFGVFVYGDLHWLVGNLNEYLPIITAFNLRMKILNNCHIPGKLIE